LFQKNFCSFFLEMLTSPRRASDQRIDGRKQALRSPGRSKKIASEVSVDTFDLFSGVVGKAATDDPFNFTANRSASVGSKPSSARQRAASPARGSPAYLEPVKNPHMVETVVSKESFDEESSEEKKDDARPQGIKTDILVLMHEGMKMYKFGKKNSKPKQKTVYLSKDNRYLKWSSNLKKAEKKQVEIATITKVEGGKKSEVYDLVRIPRDGPPILKPSLAISVYYEATPLTTKTLNLVATVTAHQQILLEGLRRLVKICRSGGEPGNVAEIFHNISGGPDYQRDSCSHLQTREQKSFRWEKIWQDGGGPRSVSPKRECVQITTGTGVKLRPFSRSLPARPPSSKSATAWV